MAALITAITQQDWRIALGGFVQGYVWAWVRRRKRRAHGADRASCGTDMRARGPGAGDTWAPLKIGHFVFEVGLRPPCSAEQPRMRQSPLTRARLCPVPGLTEKQAGDLQVPGVVVHGRPAHGTPRKSMGP